jgi:hypothetical protein
MKKTVPLKVSVSTSVDRVHLVLHPNEGFDLGLMRVAHPVHLCRGLPIEDYLKGGLGTCEEVSVSLLNECPKQTMLLGTTLHKLLGEPVKAVVLFDGDRLYVHAT